MIVSESINENKSLKLTTVGEAFKVVGGGTPSTAIAEFWDGDIPWITSADIDDKLQVTPRKYITQKAIDNSTTNLVPKGSVIVVTRVGLGKVAIAPFDLCFSQDCQGLIFKSTNVNPKYLVWQLKKIVEIFKHISRGTTISGVTKKQLLDLEIILPNLDEQEIIVAEIEKQFTRLDAGVAALKRLQANLKRYRASVLKAACEGKLVPTEAELARKEGRDYEPASVLRERILKERREKWEKENAGKVKKKYVEPKAPDVSNLPELPEGWCYSNIEYLGVIGEQTVLTGPFGTNLSRSDFIDQGIPLLTISCLTDKGINTNKAEYVSEEKSKELSRYILISGDILFSRMASVGRAGIINSNLEGALFNYHLMRLRLEPSVLSSKYFIAYVRGSVQVYSYIKYVNHGATRDGINTEQLLNMPVALPPMDEQIRISDEIERRISILDELEMVTDANLRRADRLRQAVLQKAFESS